MADNADAAAEHTVSAVPTAHDWDERYAGQERMWSGRPNGTLVAEITGRAPGHALDVGCGEGADAIWLAQNGWQVTAVDVSQVALDRAEAAARDAGVDVNWQRSDVIDTPLPQGPFDLVSAHYVPLPHTPGDDALRALLAAVAPDGILLVVGHAHFNADHAKKHGINPDDYVQAHDVATFLDDGWEIETYETRPRVMPPGQDSPHGDDIVLMARRRG